MTAFVPKTGRPFKGMLFQTKKRKKVSVSEIDRLSRCDARFNPLLLTPINSVTFDFEPYLPEVYKEPTFDMICRSAQAPSIYEAAIDGVLPPPPPKILASQKTL